MTETRKDYLLNSMIDWICEHISDEEDLYRALHNTIGMTNEEISNYSIEGLDRYYVEESSARNDQTEIVSQETPFGRSMAIRTEKENDTQIYAEVSVDDNSLDVAVLVGDDSLVSLNVSTDGENILIRKWVGFGDSEDDCINIENLLEDDNMDNAEEYDSTVQTM